ncbi:MAG: methionyl-tRNA formyltransferase [bacterium]|nr:methionyl-tRNA formyltransferase [bacterium]
MKVVFMGTPDFAVGALSALVQAGYEVTAVVTQPDKPKGRGKGLTSPPVKAFAVQHGIPVLQPSKIREPEAVAELAAYEADIYVVAAFGQILTQEILDMPRFGCVNIHASLLPKYRGAAPIQWAILDGERVTGVTIQQMNAGIDTGDILADVSVEIAPEETGDSLFEKLMQEGAALLLETLPRIEAGKIAPRAQDEAQATYAKRLSKELGQIDWQERAEVIERKIRAFTSWPGAYTTLAGKPFKLWRARVADAAADGTPGSISAVTKEEIVVNCGEGRLALREVQLSGKKRMPVRDFLLGVKIGTGEVLGV